MNLLQKKLNVFTVAWIERHSEQNVEYQWLVKKLKEIVTGTSRQRLGYLQWRSLLMQNIEDNKIYLRILQDAKRQWFIKQLDDELKQKLMERNGYVGFSS